jgi:hypothetical protein
MNDLSRQIGVLEGAYGEVTKRLDSIDQRLLQVEVKIDGFNASVNARIDRLTLAGVGAWITVMLAIFFRH